MSSAPKAPRSKSTETSGSGKPGPTLKKHATLRYDIPTVSALPAGDVGTVEAPTFVDQKYHGCFSHRFLEEYFALYWVAAERQQTWDIDARQVQVYLDGPVTKRNEAKMFKTQVNRDTGRVHVKGSPDHYFAALSADQRVLHADVAILQQHTGRLHHLQSEKGRSAGAPKNC